MRSSIRGAVLAVVALACVFFAITSSAVGLVSYYKNSPLDAAVTYDSNQRPDWYSTSIENLSGTNMNARVWAYNVITNTFVLDLPFVTFGPGQYYGSGYPAQAQTKNYCRKANGGQQSGDCYATY